MSENNDGGYIQSSPKRDYSSLKSLRSLTIAQIISIEVEEASTIFKIDDTEVTNIILIGWTRNPKSTQAGIIFNVEDGTGSIKCTYWSSNVSDDDQKDLIIEGNFIKVIGSLRLFEGGKSVHVASVQLIDDPNYLSYHFINCIYQHYYFNNKLSREAKKVGKLPKILDEVLNCIRNNQDDNGLNLNIILRMMNNKYPEENLRDAIKTLLNDCYIYSVDGDDYKTTI